MSGSSDAPRGGDASRRRDALTWIALVVAAAALGVIVWAWVTAWGAIVHGHPAYAVLLGAAALLAVLGVVVALRFQPGALVDPRAYAAVLRPLAAAGHPVVIVKQPLGIAFLALGAFDDARDVVPDADGWVIGGHSLGGTVAAMQADEHDEDTERRATGLILYASYPADDISETLTTQVLSISGTEDGLATPSKIADSAATLPSTRSSSFSTASHTPSSARTARSRATVCHRCRTRPRVRRSRTRASISSRRLLPADPSGMKRHRPTLEERRPQPTERRLPWQRRP